MNQRRCCGNKPNWLEENCTSPANCGCGCNCNDNSPANQRLIQKTYNDLNCDLEAADAATKAAMENLRKLANLLAEDGDGCVCRKEKQALCALYNALCATMEDLCEAFKASEELGTLID